MTDENHPGPRGDLAQQTTEEPSKKEDVSITDAIHAAAQAQAPRLQPRAGLPLDELKKGS